MAYGYPKRPTRRYLLESPLRRPRLVLVPALVLAVGAAAIGTLLPQRYRAAALVEGEWHDPDEALLRRRGVDVAARRAQQLRELAMQPGLLESAAPGEDAARLAADLRVRPMAKGAFVIEFTHSRAATAALVPNRIAAALASPGPSSGASAAAMDQQAFALRLAAARRVLDEKAEALARASGDRETPSSASAAAAPDSPARTELRVVEASLAAARARADRLREAVRAESVPAATDSSQEAIERLQRELGELRKRYTEEHPDVERLQRRIARLRAAQAESAAVPSPSLVELRAVEAQVEDLAARRAALEAESAARLGMPAPTAPRSSSPAFGEALAEHEQARDAYARLLEQSRLAAESAPADPAPRFRLARAAATPEASESPGPAAFALFGALLGLALGLGTALVAELRDVSVKGPEGLEEALALPLLAVVPELRRAGRQRGLRAARPSGAARR